MVSNDGAFSKFYVGYNSEDGCKVAYVDTPFFNPVALLPEASLENDAGPYRDQEPLLESSDDDSSEGDAPPEIDEVLEEERIEAEAFRNRRLGEAPPVVARGKGKLKAKASPTCVADFADLEPGETRGAMGLASSASQSSVAAAIAGLRVGGDLSGAARVPYRAPAKAA